MDHSKASEKGGDGAGPSREKTAVDATGVQDKEARTSTPAAAELDGAATGEEHEDGQGKAKKRKASDKSNRLANIKEGTWYKVNDRITRETWIRSVETVSATGS